MFIDGQRAQRRRKRRALHGESEEWTRKACSNSRPFRGANVNNHLRAAAVEEIDEPAKFLHSINQSVGGSALCSRPASPSLRTNQIIFLASSSSGAADGEGERESGDRRSIAHDSAPANAILIAPRRQRSEMGVSKPRIDSGKTLTAIGFAFCASRRQERHF